MVRNQFLDVFDLYALGLACADQIADRDLGAVDGQRTGRQLTACQQDRIARENLGAATDPPADGAGRRDQDIEYRAGERGAVLSRR